MVLRNGDYLFAFKMGGVSGVQMKSSNTQEQVQLVMFLTSFAFGEQSELLASQVPRFLLYHHLE
jgi:hypothetical protein